MKRHRAGNKMNVKFTVLHVDGTRYKFNREAANGRQGIVDANVLSRRLLVSIP